MVKKYDRAKYNIDTDLGINYQDIPPWRSYQLTTHGNTMAELIENAVIAEVDQYGDDLDYYGLSDAPTNKIREWAIEILLDTTGDSKLESKDQILVHVIPKKESEKGK